MKDDKKNPENKTERSEWKTVVVFDESGHILGFLCGVLGKLL